MSDSNATKTISILASEELLGLEEVFVINARMGNIFLKTTDTEKALKHLKDAVENCTVIISEHSKNKDKQSSKFDDKLLFLSDKKNELNKNIIEAYYKQGDIFLKNGDWENAVNSFIKVLKNNPDDNIIYHNLALCFRGLGNTDSAIDYLNKSIRLNKNYIFSYKEMADIYISKRDEIKALEIYEKCLRLDDKNVDIYNLLGFINQILGYNDKAFNFFQKATDLEPSYQIALSNLLFTSIKIPGFTQEDIYKLTTRYVNNYLKKINFNPDDIYKHEKGDKDKKINIGYISGDFWNHVTMHYILPVFENYNKEKFTVTCYSSSEISDGITEKCKSLVDNFRDVKSMGNKEIAKTINDDKIDIMVDLSGHSKSTRVFSMAYKPAPVQVTYLGYPNTTGLESIDYLLTNNILNTREDECFFSEKLYFMDGDYFCYRPKFAVPEKASNPCVKNGYITFGVFNSLSKFSDELFKIWSEILLNVPNSKLLICRTEIKEEIFIPKFEKYGIDKNRLILETNFSFKKYDEVDIHLDTFPYTGVSVFFDSIFMGVPVITLYGKTLQGRVASNINYSLGLKQLVAKTEKEYVEKAVYYSKNIEEINEIKASLKQRIEESGISDYKAFTRDLENSFFKMWEEYCNKQF